MTNSCIVTAAHRLLQRLLVFVAAIAVVFGVLALPAAATGVNDLPNIGTDDSTWVVDQADVISRNNEGRLNSVLAKLAKETGNGVNLVAIRRLDYGETIDSFADKLFNTWFATPEARANQTLLLVDSLTNNVAIRTGEAVEAVMNNDIAQSVARDTLGTPLREDSKYNQAFLAASDRLVAVLSGNPDPGPPNVQDTLNIEGTFTAAEDTNTSNATIWVIGLLIVATIIPMATYYLFIGTSN